MKGLKCPKCGKDAPVSGGIYQKRYSHAERGMRWFWFPTYMCEDDDCQLDFIIVGARLYEGDKDFTWQDSDVKREDWEHAEDWED